ncbi:MAG TPA: hypothetical protein DCQ98_07295 [Planctomycetaceae bacterium]|nr:hypothetical protein [Planctomycetaceae bacterium]HRF00078.1 hypothetical protein [Pirellulaceae bacterium]
MSLLPLIDPGALFAFRLPLRRFDGKWGRTGVELPEAYRLPTFAELAGKRPFADVRGAWNESGLLFEAKVVRKSQVSWCREGMPADSDGLHLWIDTRDTHTIHRASRYCHRFMAAPIGAGKAGIDPFAVMLSIPRAKEEPKSASREPLPVVAKRLPDGYWLAVRIPADRLFGYEPIDHPRIGFFYSVVDRELGNQNWNLGGDYPYVEDPSLWGTADLVGADEVT